MKPEVTVLMPNFNNAAFLEESIDSILHQSFRNFVFLIVDDGSTDNSISIIKKYADSRIRLIQKEKNSGIVDTLNIGLEQLDTKYMLRMDGDDISTPDRIQMLYDFMELNEKVGICGSQMQIFGNENAVTNYYTDPEKIKARLIFNNGVSHASCIFRTSVLKKSNVLYRNLHPYMEDYDLFFRLKDQAEFANIDKVLFHYRRLSHNSTIKNEDSVIARYRNIYRNLVLPALEIEPTENNVEKHLEFFIKPELSFSIKEYKNWVELLISQNKKTNAFPQNALEEILKERWDIFFFKVVPKNLGMSINYLLTPQSFSFSKLSYLLKCKAGKLMRKNTTS